MSDRGTVIFVDDEEHMRRASGQALELADYAVEPFEAAEPALDHLSEDFPGILVSDVRMPGLDGLELMRRVRAVDPDLPVVLISGHADISTAVQAIRDGAYDFIEKPFSSDHLVDVVGRAMEKRRLTLENRRLRREVAEARGSGPCIIGDSPGLRKLRRMIDGLADTDADVLVRGETGTGKELVARWLHDHGKRREGNFVAVNCGAVPETLMESEIFGHESGAFTGASERRIGKVEHANGGTLFLDEIESMPLALQVKLLRVLQERSIERLGSNKVIPLDLRVVAASKVDLKAACDEGTFREDLYYRLNVIAVDIPPLRDRAGDIALLFTHFLDEASARFRREPPAVPPDQLHALSEHDWPGNVRELQHAAERFALFGDWRAAEMGEATEAEPGRGGLVAQMERFEKGVLVEVLTRHRGDVAATTAELSLPRKTFYDKLKKYDLSRKDFLEP